MEVIASTNIRQHQNIMKKGIVLLMFFAILTSCNKNEELSQNLGGNPDPVNTELVFPEELFNSDFNILFIAFYNRNIAF